MRRFLIIVLAYTIVNVVVGQDIKNNYFPVSAIESRNDSIDISNTLMYYEDSLGYYFFTEKGLAEKDVADDDEVLMTFQTDASLIEGEEITADEQDLSDVFTPLNMYENFDNEAIHYRDSTPLDKKIATLVLVNDTSHYVHPFENYVTSPFGPRRHRYHYGMDIKLLTGDPVRAAFDGVVRIAKPNKSYGRVIVIRHYNGLETLYAHLSRVLVQPNQVVKAGDIIGLGGNTGRSYGSHLHFETRFLGSALNPNDLIDFENYRLKSDTLHITSESFSYIKAVRQARQHTQSVAGASRYTVRKGDTLSRIAARNRTTVAKLKKLNKLRGDNIREGQRLRLR